MLLRVSRFAQASTPKMRWTDSARVPPRQKRSPAFGRARLAPLSETEIAGRSVAAVLAAAEANGFNPSDEAEDKAQALSGSCWIHRHCCPGTFGPRRQGLLKTGLFRNPRWSRQEMINRARFAAGPAAFGRDAGAAGNGADLRRQCRSFPAVAQFAGDSARFRRGDALARDAHTHGRSCEVGASVSKMPSSSRRRLCA